MYYIVDTTTNRVEYSGRLSDCATYLSSSLPDEHLVLKELDDLTEQQLRQLKTSR